MQVNFFLKLYTCIYKTWIVTHFYVYIVQMWSPFSDIFVSADVVNAQSGEVYSLNIQSSHLKRLRGKLGQTLSPKTTGKPPPVRVAPVVVVEI